MHNEGWMLWGNYFVRNCLISYTFLSYIHFHFSSFRVTRQESALLVSRKVHSISLQRTSTTWEPMTGTQTGNLLIKMPALLEFWQHFAKIQIALSLCAVVASQSFFKFLLNCEPLRFWIFDNSAKCKSSTVLSELMGKFCIHSCAAPIWPGAW